MLLTSNFNTKLKFWLSCKFSRQENVDGCFVDSPIYFLNFILCSDKNYCKNKSWWTLNKARFLYHFDTDL